MFKVYFALEQSKNPGCLGYTGDRTTQLCGERDYSKPLQYKDPLKQPVQWKVSVFFVAHLPSQTQKETPWDKRTYLHMYAPSKRRFVSMFFPLQRFSFLCVVLARTIVASLNCTSPTGGLERQGPSRRGNGWFVWYRYVQLCYQFLRTI